MKFLSTLLVLALVASPFLLASADDSGDVRNNDGSRFQFAGQGGELRLKTTNGTTIKVRFHKIVEVDGNGNPVATTKEKLEDRRYSFITPSQSTFPGTTYSVLNTGFSSQLAVSAANPGGESQGNKQIGTTNFGVQVYRFNENAVLPNGNGNSVTVNANDVKFSVVMSAWPFASKTNKLRLSLKILIEGSDDDNRNNGNDRSIQRKGDGKNEQSIPFPANKGRLDLSLVATADGINVPVTLSTFRADGNGGVAVFLPYFNSTLVYDPTLSEQPASNIPAYNQVSSASSASVSLAAVMLTVFAIVALF